ncbi:hypothetical protein KSP40_PGU018276 [Platanthera guangdongensis]|uniref:Uncharacterized protein n=1 Tax=Platanthera guangdongensis TaxID=2320717 RepID=A0ABR2MK21_9ASPA
MSASQALIAYSSYDMAARACCLDGYILEHKRLTVLFHKTKEECEADMNDRGHVIYPSEPLLRMQKTEQDVRNLGRRVEISEGEMGEMRRDMGEMRHVVEEIKKHLSHFMTHLSHFAHGGWKSRRDKKHGVMDLEDEGAMAMMTSME